MSQVIKARGSNGIRPFGTVETAQPAKSAPVPKSDEAVQLERLVQENRGLKDKLRELSASMEGALVAAGEEGRREAAAAAVRDEEARIAVLRTGIDDALTAWESRLAQLESLASLISRTALAKLFERSESYSELVLDCMARQLRQLRQEAVVAVRVSTADFPDEAELERIRSATLSGIPIMASAELGAGECRLDLQVGHIDVGPATQWPRLSALLQQIAVEASA